MTRIRARRRAHPFLRHAAMALRGPVAVTVAVVTAFVLGYCQGGTLATMYAALRPARVRGLVALNTPVCFREGGRFREFVDAAVFDAAR